MHESQTIAVTPYVVRARELPGFSLVIKTRVHLTNVLKSLIKVFQVFNDQPDLLFADKPLIGEHQSPIKTFHDICIGVIDRGTDIGRISHRFPVHSPGFVGSKNLGNRCLKT